MQHYLFAWLIAVVALIPLSFLPMRDQDNEIIENQLAHFRSEYRERSKAEKITVQPWLVDGRSNGFIFTFARRWTGAFEASYSESSFYHDRSGKITDFGHTIVWMNPGPMAHQVFRDAAG